MPVSPASRPRRARRGLCQPLADGGFSLDFALSQQTRRYARPNRVRHPADRKFASSCSPHRLAAMQLLSTIRSEHLLKGTCTPLLAPARRRTGSGFPAAIPSGRFSRLESRSHKEMEAIEIGFCGCLASLIVRLEPGM